MIEIERVVEVVRKLKGDWKLAEPLGQYRAFQVVTYARAAKVDPIDLIRNDRVIGVLPLSQHTKATLQAAITNAFLRQNWGAETGGGSEPSSEAETAAKMLRRWIKRAKIPDAQVRLTSRHGVDYVQVLVPASEVDVLLGTDPDSD